MNSITGKSKMLKIIIFVFIFGFYSFNKLCGLSLKEYYMYEEDKKMNYELFDIRIPSDSKKAELVLSFPKCIYNSSYIPQYKVTKYMLMQYPKSTFSGNVYGEYVCPTVKDRNTVDLKISTTPNVKVSKNKPQEINDYLIEIIEYGSKKNSHLIDAKNNMKLYKIGINRYSIFIYNFPLKKHDIVISFTGYDPELVGAGFMEVYRVETFLSDDFQAEYEVFTSKALRYDDSAFTSKIDNKFADDFYRVINNQDNILDYPEIINAFIVNNERVVEYIKANSKENIK